MFVFVFSAYYVAEKGAVYVIGARVRTIREVFCQLWFHSKSSVVFAKETKANITAPDGGMPSEYPYTATIFECPSAIPSCRTTYPSSKLPADSNGIY